MPTYPHQLKLGKTYMPDAGVPERTASAVAALWTLLEAPDLILAHRRHLLGIAIWKYTEAPGVPPHPKYRLPYRTAGAMDICNMDMVQHEHVWPRKWIIDRLLRHHEAGWTREALADFMMKHGVSCTVTRTEHLLLNSCGDTEGWDRYAQVGLQVWDAANGRPLKLAALPTTVTEDDKRRVLALPTPGMGVVSEVILAALAANGSPATASLRDFLQRAEDDDIDLVPKYDVAGRPTTYIKLFDAELEEATPVAAYVNYNGNVDFHVPAAKVSELIGVDGVLPWKSHYVRIAVDQPARVETALQLLTQTLEHIRET
jgi:hypothetical protein